MSAPADPTLTDDAFAALDAYLARLHAGAQPDKAAVLARHPELGSALDCLDALDGLAPPPSAAAADGDATRVAGPADLAAHAAPPPEFGKFELLAELGRGGMGVVYKAHQRDLDRTVALKMILASHLASEEVVRRFLHEARAAAAVQHPHVTAIYEAGQIHGQHYIAIQYVGGPSLAQHLRQGPLAPETAARIVAAVASAVQHLHEHGIIHRDLKPSNILLDEEGRPYVTDFGLVKTVGTGSHQTSTGAILGTPSYMSPEQAAGLSGEVGALSDVYSIGAVLYECLTGRPPFRELTQLDTLVQVIEGEPARPREVNPRVPPDLEAVCLRCLEKSPERRYPNAAAVAENLEKYLNGEPVEGLTSGLWAKLGRWARREPALVSRLGTLAAVCVLLQVNYHWAANVPLWLHLVIMGLLLLWGASSYVFQKLLNLGRWQEDLPFLWAGADMLLWTIVLFVDREAPQSPLLVGYGCLIVAAGLWFKVRLVWFVTILSELSYAAVLSMFLLDGNEMEGPHRHVIFAVGIFVLGSMVAYQINRVKALSRYYERRPLPR
jgi:serine/threonine-protein kinase